MAAHPFSYFWNQPVEVIQLFLDSNVENKLILENKSILAKTLHGCLPIHIACSRRAPVEVIQLLLDSDTEKKTIHEKDNNERLPIYLAFGLLLCCTCRGDSIVAGQRR
jgi:hypothetical protein